MVVISRVVVWFMFLSVNCKASLDHQKFMGKYLSQDTFITKLFGCKWTDKKSVTLNRYCFGCISWHFKLIPKSL